MPPTAPPLHRPMTRVVVLGITLLFIVGLGGLTVGVLTSEGITLGGLVLPVIALGVLIVLGVGIIGALRKPPPR